MGHFYTATASVHGRRGGTSLHRRLHCHVEPEIAAAVRSFIYSRAAQDGIYVYFDIGSGTLDGVSFRFRRADGTPELNFYAGKVEHLGVNALIDKIVSNPNFGVDETISPREVESLLLEGERKNDFPFDLGPQIDLIRKLVGDVIMTAKKKDPAELRKSFEDVSRISYLRHSPNRDYTRALPVFIGGGGMNSDFYNRSIVSTYSEFGHFNAGIPKYALARVPIPSDLEFNGFPKEEFHRFAIAYGLSVLKGEGPEIRPPRDFDPMDPLPRKPFIDVDAKYSEK